MSERSELIVITARASPRSREALSGRPAQEADR
jgi:hypothetical protein